MVFWKTRPGLSGTALKLAACITMLIDHIGASCIEATYGVAYRTPPQILQLDRVLRLIGRLAFPIFCFLIAEGCVYTRDRRKYALRLLAFALLSEVPFDLMVGGTVWYPYSQNVLWTLLAGALICWCVDWALRKKTPAAFLLTGAAVAAAFCLLELAGTDYRGWGMLLVVLFYGVRRVSCGTVVKRTAQAVGLAVFSIGIMGGVSIELWSLAALLPLWLYNGRRGYSNRAVQYGFYAFYPVHILILSLIALYV